MPTGRPRGAGDAPDGDVRLSGVTETTEPRVRRFATATAFLAAAGDFLGEREAEHNLLFGICADLTADPGFPAAPPYLAVVSNRDRVTGAAIMTPPWNVVLSCTDDPGAVEALASDLDAAEIPVPGTTGPVEVARAFASAWCEPRGLVSHRGVAERIYQLERVVPPVGVPGQVRIATEADRALLVDWVDAFLAEALERRTPEEAAVLVDRSFRAGTRTWYLWEDGGRSVSVAGSAGPTPNGIRIGPVYTPPGERRRGYASAVTAATSQAELDKGRRFVFLFTDLSNQTSNKIYRQIGYEPVIDVDQLAFVPAEAAAG
jgi:predicted GNAT family acetyltransferase